MKEIIKVDINVVIESYKSGVDKLHFFFFFFCQRQQEIEIPGNNDLCEGFCNTINSFSRRSKSIEIQSIIKKIQKENTLNTLRKNILKTCLGIFFERFKDALRDFSMSCVLITIGE